MFKKKIPEMLNMIRLSNRPSTVVMVPVAMIQPIPARGMRPNRIEIRSITGNNSPPRKDGRQCSVLSSGFERRVDRLAVLGRQSDFLRLLAELFMDECDGVIAWRQALNLKLAIRPGDREEGALGDVDEHPHPRMLVALHGQHDFFAREILLERCGLRGLRFVPLTVVLRSGMNIVCGGIAVDDLDGLPGHYTENVRMIAAATLIEREGLLGDVEGAAAQALLDVNEDVREMTVRDDYILGDVCAFAGGILAHVNLRGLGGSAIEFHNADDRRGASGINRCG